MVEPTRQVTTDTATSSGLQLVKFPPLIRYRIGRTLGIDYTWTTTKITQTR